MRLTVLTAFLVIGIHVTAFAGGNATEGQTKSATCVACHGIDGNSVDPANPKLAGQHEDYIMRQLQLFRSGERVNPVMDAMVTNLSDTDIADLGAYFASQKVRAGIADEALVEHGQKLYRGGAPNGLPSCMGCHGPSGHGNPAAKYPAIGGQHANYIKAQLQQFRAGGVYGNKEDAHNLIMSQVAKNLSDADIDALASYLEGLHTAE
jgi:cytochrome c553